MDWDRFLTFVIVAGGLGTALSPIVTAFLQARGKRDENEIKKNELHIEKEKTSQDGYDKLTDQLQEALDKAIAYNDKLDAKIKEQDSERGLIISELKIRSEESDRKDRAIEKLSKELDDAHRQIAVVEETNRASTLRLNNMLKEQGREINGVKNMAKEAKKNTDELKEELKQTGQLPDDTVK
jgi:hypothetical protein